VGSERRACFKKQRVLMALQGHARSLILAPIESAYAISYWSSIVTLVLSAVWKDRESSAVGIGGMTV